MNNSSAVFFFTVYHYAALLILHNIILFLSEETLNVSISIVNFYLNEVEKIIYFLKRNYFV